MDKIKVAIAGLGNCASSLVQGIEKYKKTKESLGFISEKIGEYSPEDMEFVAVFDISKNKVVKI